MVKLLQGLPIWATMTLAISACLIPFGFAAIVRALFSGSGGSGNRYRGK